MQASPTINSATELRDRALIAAHRRIWAGG
jgi:hypothetical protein